MKVFGAKTPMPFEEATTETADRQCLQEKEILLDYIEDEFERIYNLV